MTDVGNIALDEAIRWHMSLADGDGHDWDAFTLWLEADPANAAAYDQVEAGDIDARDILPTLKVADAIAAPAPIAANDNPSRRTWWFGGGAIAAAVALMLAWGPTMLGSADPYSVATAAGETREIALASGDMVAINGNSRVTFDRSNPRYAQLDSGEASFRVTHDPANPFEVRVGDAMVRDVGTVFNIVRSGQAVRVAVAEGSVIYNPGAGAVTLTAGQMLTDPGDGSPLVRGTIEPAAVTGWQSGQLSYRDAPLSQLIDDLARTTGEPVMLAQGLADRTFTGTVRIDPDRERMFADLAILLNVRTEHRSDGWHFVEAGRAAN